MGYGRPYCRRCNTSLQSVQRGHSKCLKYFLRVIRDPNVIITVEKWKKTGVMRSGENGDFIQKRFVRMNTTLLHIACKKGYGDCVRILLNDDRIDPNILLGGESPLFMLCDMDDTKFDPSDIILLFLKNPRVEINLDEPGSAFLRYVSRYKYTIDENVFEAFLKKEKCADLVFKKICCKGYNDGNTPYYIKLLLSSNKVSEQMIYGVYKILKDKNERTTDCHEERLTMIEGYISSLPVIKEPST